MTWSSSRRPWAMNSRTYSVRKVSVWTVKRSAAQRRGRWLATKVRQVWLGGRAGPRRRRYCWMERLLTTMRASAARRGSARCPGSGSPAPSWRSARGLRRSAEPAARSPAPEQLPHLPMPADHGLGPDEDQMATPVAADRADQGPEQLVTGAEPGAFPGGARRHRELLVQQEVLCQQIVAVAYDRAERGHKEEQILERHPEMMRPSGSQLPGRVSRPHTWSGERVDPAFAENKRAIVALYTAPPAGRAVICLAEMGRGDCHGRPDGRAAVGQLVGVSDAGPPRGGPRSA